MKFSEIPVLAPGQNDTVVGVTIGNVDARFPVTDIGGRTKLTANANFDVNNITGSDSNPGTLAQPFLTLQHAWDFLAGSLDLAEFTITINLAGNGTTHPYFIDAASAFIGGSGIIILGAGSSSTFIEDGLIQGTVTSVQQIYIDQVTLRNNNSGFAFQCYAPGLALTFITAANFGAGDVVFDAGSAPATACLAHITVQGFGTGAGVAFFGNITIKNSASIFLQLTGAAGATVFAGNASFSGTPAFSIATIYVDQQSYAFLSFGWCTGAATGKRFLLGVNSAIYITGGGDPAGTQISGSSAGVLANSGTFTNTSNGQYQGISDFAGLVANLPTATVINARAVVTDALAPSFGSIVAGGGGVLSPVYADGTHWRCG